MGDPLERLGSKEAIGIESCMKEELCMEINPPFQENVTTAEDWRKALNTVVPTVVVLWTTACRAFDTQGARASYAIGFVLNFMTSICVVIFPNSVLLLLFIGPVVAEGMFVNREEIPLYPIYKDLYSSMDTRVIEKGRFSEALEGGRRDNGGR
ncbi:hypothetical protein PVL29_004322 [Vitis rotundifolia]|uniref:Uncharacterized protein n=1 Tax=Vitis rotundifolia TaxID=103349 RepID=A0AA39A893_VITRO|nr:hypothetical protein PVL29_004322 [Vitis rotundifolia]